MTMRKKAVLTLALAALLAVPGVAHADAQVIDFNSMMTSLAEGYIALVSDYAYMFLHPTGIADLDAFATAQGHPDTYNPGDSQEACDNNRNGVVDIVEFKLLEAIFADAGHPLHATVHEAYKSAITQLGTDLGALAASLAPTLKNVMAAYAVIGDGSYQRYTYAGVDYNYGNVGSWGAVAEVIAGMDAFGSLWTENDAPNPVAYGRYPELLGMCGDADSDGVANINEFYAAADTAAYVAAALNSGTTASAADPNNSCAAGNTGWEFGVNLFYNPANGSVYALVANAIFPACRDIAQNFELGGTAIPGALVHINDEAENIWVSANVRAITGDGGDNNLWLGATDEATEGTWLWVDNNAVFFQGTGTAGGPVGGLYENFNGAEPNDSGGEDYCEMSTGGGWNDNAIDEARWGLAEFSNGGAGYADANSDGIPEFWAALLSLTNVTISGAPTAEVLVGAAVSVEAASDNVSDTEFAWVSSNTAVATVAELSATEATVTAVGAGTATITATANVSGASQSFDITVRQPEWYEICEITDAFDTQGAGLASVLEQPYAEWDLDQDGVLDSWQLYLLGYDICNNPSGPAAAEYASNRALMQQMGADIAAVGAWLGNGADGQLIMLGYMVYAAGAQLQAASSEMTTLGSLLGGSVTTLLVTYPQVIGAVCQEMADVQPDLAAYGPVINMVWTDILTGLVGLDSELRAGIPELLTLPTIEYQLNNGTPFTSQLTNVSGIMVPIPLLMGDLDALLEMPLFPVMELGAQTDYAILTQVQAGVDGAYGAGAFNAMMPKAKALRDAVLAFATKYATLGNNSFQIPDFDVFSVGSKLPGEPFSGWGDYDGDGVLNYEVFNVIQGQGGDVNDFIIGAAGTEGPFWPGNPGLPVAGLTGLVTLALALGSAAVLRRK